MTNSNYVLGNEWMLLDASLDASGNMQSGTKILGYGTECTLSLSADQIDVANKQLGYWSASLPGSISWTLSSSSLYVNDTTVVDYSDLFDKIALHDEVPIVIGRIKEEKRTKLAEGQDLTYEDFDVKFWGNAYMTSLELSASNNEACSYSVEFVGNGHLHKKD